MIYSHSYRFFNKSPTPPSSSSLTTTPSSKSTSIPSSSFSSSVLSLSTLNPLPLFLLETSVSETLGFLSIASDLRPTSVLTHVLHHFPITLLIESSSARYSIFLTTPCQVARPCESARSIVGVSPLFHQFLPKYDLNKHTSKANVGLDRKKQDRE
jgi:hypothetical protein